MDHLVKESDSLYRTSSGHVAVMLKRVSGITPNGDNYFEFQADAFSSVVRVEWPRDAPVALFEPSVANVLLRLGYAYSPNDDIVEQFNAAVDQVNNSQPTPAPTPAKAAKNKPAEPAKAGEQAPANSGEGDGGGTKSGEGEQPEPVVFVPPEGWLPHPTSPGYFYKDQDVKTEAELRAMM